MKYRQLLFSFKGRINRRTFWMKVILPLALIDLSYLLMFFKTLHFWTVLHSAGTYSNSSLFNFISLLCFLLAIAIFPLVFFTIWISLAASAKRLHDRNMSGWWQIISLVPYLGNLWSIIIGLLKGQIKENKYGPPPETIEEKKNYD